jgi:hypothetical protein
VADKTRDAERQALDAHAIELITALAHEGAVPSIINITTAG